MEKKRSIGVTILAILLITLGFINIYTLPTFIVEVAKDLRIKKDTPESVIAAYGMRMEDSKKEKYITYMNSEQGRQHIKEINEYRFNSLRRISQILFPVSQKLLWCIALILGLSLFFLKESARKITIILAAIQIPITIAVNYITYVPFMHMIKINMKYGFFDKFVENFNYKTISSIPFGIYLMITLSIIFFSSCIIYFLTRLKIKEQFR